MNTLLKALYAIISRLYNIQVKVKYLNTKFLDNLIKIISCFINIQIKDKNLEIKKTSIGICASILYPTGGHTKCVFNLLDSLVNIRNTSIFISNITQTRKNSETIYKKIINIENSFYFEYDTSYINYVLKIYKTILNNPPEVIICFIHPEDIVFATVLCLIKKNTNIKLLFFSKNAM